MSNFSDKIRLGLLHGLHIAKSHISSGTVPFEQNSLNELYRSAVSLWHQHPAYLDDTGEYMPKFFTGCVVDLLKIYKTENLPVTSELELIIGECFFEFTRREPSIFAEPSKPTIIGQVSLQQQAKTLTKLQRYVKHNTNLDATVEQWVQDVASIIFELLQLLSLPPAPNQSAPASLFLETKLFEFARDPVELLDACVGYVESESATRDEFFKVVLFRLLNNFNKLAGVDHHMKAGYTFAGAYERSPTLETADALLKGTPQHILLMSRLPVPVTDEYRFEHCHILAGTGVGKTQLLQQMILADLSRDPSQVPGMVIIDSHGDMLGKLKKLALFDAKAGAELGRRLLIIDPSDVDFTPQLNLFDVQSFKNSGADEKTKQQLFNGIIETFDFIFSGLLGAELTARQSVAFRFLAEMMMEIPDASIYTFKDVLENPGAFTGHMQNMPPVTRDFLLNQFSQKRYNDVRHYILNRLYMMMQNKTFQAMFGTPRNRLDLYDTLNKGGIVLVDTSKDFLKKDVSALFGRYMIANTFKAVLERAAIPEHQRRPCFLYVDEAGEYFDSSFNNLITQARKYKLGLIFAHQVLDQLPKELRNTVLGSTSIKIAAGISDLDARAMAPEMGCSPEFIKQQTKTTSGSDFAIFVRNLTQKAASYHVEFGRLERQPVMSEQHFKTVLAASRKALTGRTEPLEEPARQQASAPAPETHPRQAASEVNSKTIPQEVDDMFYDEYDPDAAPGWNPHPPKGSV